MQWKVLLAALAIAGCGGDDDGSGDTADGDAGPPELVDVEVMTTRSLDVLFVVDDSATMRQEQQALAAGFPAFVDALTGGDEVVDLHFGLVSSNLGTEGGGGGESCAGLGDGGHLLVGAGCPALTDGAHFVSHRVDVGGGADVNYTGELSDQLMCMAQLGTSGCGFEQHLGSMRRALMNSDQNAGFLRDDANLALIVLA